MKNNNMITDSNLPLLMTAPQLPSYADEETLIEDHRAAVRPAQLVEQKLLAALQTAPVFLSRMQDVKRPHDR